VSRAYLRLQVPDAAVREHQDPQGPQAGEGPAGDVAQVVPAQLQQPGAARDAGGHALQRAVAAVHQVGVLVTGAARRTRGRAAGGREKRRRGVEGEEGDEEGREPGTHVPPEEGGGRGEAGWSSVVRSPWSQPGHQENRAQTLLYYYTIYL